MTVPDSGLPKLADAYCSEIKMVGGCLEGLKRGGQFLPEVDKFTTAGAE